MAEPAASKPPRAALLRGLAAAAALLLLSVLPAPYVLYEPGVVVPVGELAVVKKITRTDSPLAESGVSARQSDPDEPESNGGLLMATVHLDPRVRLWRVIESAWREDREVHSKRAVFQGIGEEEYKARMDVLMADSRGKAAEAAFRLAGVRYEAAPDGVYAARGGGRLETGDRILAVDGDAVDGLDELAKALRARAGREAGLTVLRGGSEISVRLAADETGAGAVPDRLDGAELIEIRAVRPADSGLSVTIDAGGFGGPSAGLPLALHLYERLSGEPLTGGLLIAATGTIEPSGEIGAVGGVRMKAIAAARAGADLFLVPKANAAEAAEAAEAAGGGMVVAGVGTLEEAVSLLRAGSAR